jgi:hypothetical protein
MPIFDDITIVIDKDGIENLDYTPIRDYMSNFDFNESLLYENKSKLDINIYGYDNDKRELYEVLEVLNWAGIPSLKKESLGSIY